MSGAVYKRGPIFVPEADPEPFDPLAPRWHHLPAWLRWLVDPARGRLLEHVRR
jgi:hypothetical protein